MLYDGGGAHGAVPDAGGIMHTATAVTMWMRHMAPLFSLATIRGRRHTLERFCRDLNNPALKAIRSHHVTDWLAAQANCGPASTRAMLSHFRCFFRWAVQHHHLKVDPTATIPSVKQPRRVPRALSPEEVHRLVAVLPDERAMLVVTLLGEAGLRRAEVTTLDIADVDMREGTLRVCGKGGNERVLPIPTAVHASLVRYLPIRGPGAGPLIRSQLAPHVGISPDRIGQMMNGWLRDAGVKSTAFDGKSSHALRHYFAEGLIERGAEVRDVATALGHAHDTTALLYLRNRAGIARLRELMAPDIEPPLGVSQVLDGHRGTWNRPFPAYQVGAPALREVGQSLRSA